MSEQVAVRIPDYLIKVPKEVILARDIPVQRISTYLYINCNQTWDKQVHYSPTYMLGWSGYSSKIDSHPNRDPNSVYQKFKQSMKWLFANGYILDFDERKYIQNIFQSSAINEEKLLPNDNFGIIYDFEFEAIMKCNINYRPLSKSILLLVLSYIKAFTWTRFTSYSGYSKHTRKEKPEILHTYYKLIGEEIGISEKMVSKAVDVLVDVGILVTHKMPNYQDQDGYWHTDETIFAFKYKIGYTNNKFTIFDQSLYNYQEEIKYGILFLRDKKHSSKKFYQD